MKIAKSILPILVLAQFSCVSLWFAGNAVILDLAAFLGLKEDLSTSLTSAVQFGFILGTLVFAILSIADKYSPSRIFFISAILGALFNVLCIFSFNNFYSLLGLRFLVGICLAGIYPIGMKIAADYYDKGLGKSLGFLVGALVLGTAFPHLLKSLTQVFSVAWQLVLLGSSILAILGGSIVFLFVADGPYRKASTKFDPKALFHSFQSKEFRVAAFGYFGHMWELYAFWAFVPFLFKKLALNHPEWKINVSLNSFFVIGIGAIACVLGGYISEKIGSKKTAFLALFSSLSCCLLSLIFLQFVTFLPIFLFLLLWGIFVIADSPLFSSLVAQNTLVHLKGSALTLVNCIGFTITIFSIQLLQFLSEKLAFEYIFLALAIGPLFGWIYQKLQKG